MPQVERSKSKSRKAPFVMGSVVVLVLLVAISVVAVILHKKPPAPVPSTATVLAEAENLAFVSKYPQAISLLQGQLKYAKTTDERDKIYYALGVDEASAGNMQASVTYYQRVSTVKTNASVLEVMASDEAQAGNKPAAIQYYQQAEQAIKSGQDKIDARDLNYIQAQLNQLGASS